MASPVQPFTVGEADQSRRLELCGIDPLLYEGSVDPSAYTALAIQQASLGSEPLPTGVHAGQRLVIKRFARTGEAMGLTCATTAPLKVERGDLIRFSAALVDSDGTALVETTEDLIVLNQAAPSRGKAAVAALAPDVVVSHHGAVVFDPVRVAAYCGPEVNPIHFDPVAATTAGFRAPIIGGEQGIRHIMALIWRTLRPPALDISLRFLRPLFWDDRCELTVEARDGRWTSVSLVKDGKKATEVTLHA